MITRLRQRHRRTWLILAIVLPAILLLAWNARQSVPVMDRLPVALQEEPKP